MVSGWRDCANMATVKKEPAYDPLRWEPGGLCSFCYRAFQVRNYGREQRHTLDETKLCTSKRKEPANEPPPLPEIRR